MILNVHNLHKENSGDIHSSPLLHYPLKGIKATTNGNHYFKYENVIVGGGGIIISAKWWKKIEANKIIVWGAGCNFEGAFKYPDDFDSYNLVGVRDYGVKYRWVPCVSCKLPFEDYLKKTPQHEVVCLEHKMKPLNLDLPTVDNFNELKNILSHIASGSVIVTNSYHGAYWSILMNRKTVIVDPQSNRFYGFKWQPPICLANDWRHSLKIAKQYPEALEEARKANDAFFTEVSELLNL